MKGGRREKTGHCRIAFIKDSQSGRSNATEFG